MLNTDTDIALHRNCFIDDHFIHSNDIRIFCCLYKIEHALHPALSLSNIYMYLYVSLIFFAPMLLATKIVPFYALIVCSFV